jgi:hypothetical protein
MSERHFPPGGRPPSSELENILAQVQQHWRGLRVGPIVGLVGLVIALIFLWSSWFTVQPEETGVVQRFGQVVRTAGPGLHFKWPYGIDTVRLVPTARVLKEEFGFRSLATTPSQRTQYTSNQAYKSESLMLTGDLNVIDVQRKSRRSGRRRSKRKSPGGGRRSPARSWPRPGRSSPNTASSWSTCASNASTTFRACARRSRPG